MILDTQHYLDCIMKKSRKLTKKEVVAKKLGVQYIYESPDGGETVYAREVGNYTDERKMVSKSEKAYIEEEFKRRHHYITPEAVKLCWKHRGLQKAWEKYIMLLELYGHSEE